MQQQEKKIKGFNILELLVVIVIVGVLSAAAYPNFSDWRRERVVRTSAIKIKNLMQNINAQVQRGLYAYVQVSVENTADHLIVTSKGMKTDTLAKKVNSSTSDWNQNSASRCNTDNDAYWDDSGAPSIEITYRKDDEGNIMEDAEGNQIIESETEVPNTKLEVAQLILGKVTTTFSGTAAAPERGAVCFSKNARWYSGAENFLSIDPLDVDGANTSVDTILFICLRNNDFPRCDIEPTNGVPNTDHPALFLVEWSRFGNITMSKWVDSVNDWTLQ